MNGKRLRYPRWFLYRDDKEMKVAFERTFGQHLLTPAKPERILRSYATLNMVPKDLFDLLRTIQASGNP